MYRWSDQFAEEHIHDFTHLKSVQQQYLLPLLDAKFPVTVYEQHRACQLAAIKNTENAKNILAGSIQQFPHLISQEDLRSDALDLSGYGFVLTAGGEGERLRTSLLLRGASPDELADFTKATYALPGISGSRGSLQINLELIAHLSKTAQVQVPVIVTTGPVGSTTHRVIPNIIARNNAFGLTQARTLAQDERLHLTTGGKIVFTIDNGMPKPVVNPDETGGPFMKLAAPGFYQKSSAIEWFRSFGCTKIIALQATALYDPSIIHAMVVAGRQCDCLGVGVLRKEFDEKDPFGSFVSVNKAGVKSLVIIEQAIRNEATMLLTDESGTYHVPYNTGLYVFDLALLEGAGLPDYATPPKEIVPSLPKSPKIGYAATDLVSVARNAAVLAIAPGSCENIKSADDLPKLSALAKRCKLVDL